MFKPIKDYEYLGHVWIENNNRTECEICGLPKEDHDLFDSEKEYEAQCKCAGLAYARWNIKKSFAPAKEREVREDAGQLRLNL